MAKVEQYSKINGRITLLYWVFGFAFVVLLASLAYRQIYLYDDYAKRGDRQAMRRIIEPGSRGDIYDRNGKLIVTNSAHFSAVVYFNDLRKEFREEYRRLKKLDIEAQINAGVEKPRIESSKISLQARKNILNGYVEQVNKILGADYKLTGDDFNRHFSQRALLPFPIIKNLSSREHAILAEKIPVDSPLQISTDTSRYYPHGESAAHALGYIGSNLDDVDTSGIPGGNLLTYSFIGKRGVTGLEKAFDESLTGRSGAKIWVIDKDGFQYDQIADISPSKGRDLFSSIDMDLQQTIEDAMPERKGAVVVLDVQTGEVLAMVSRPSYNPNLFSPFMTNKVSAEITERGAWLNRATQGLYPPGSTYKILTALAASKAGKLDPDEIVKCDGAIKVGRRIISCHKKSGHGEQNLEDAIANSCNVYFIKKGLDAGNSALAETAKIFGFDSPSGLEISEDYSKRTIIPSVEVKKRRGEGGWSLGDTANVSIGQGLVLQTPLNMARFTASLARKQTRTKVSLVRNLHNLGGLNHHGAQAMDIPDTHYDTIVRGMLGAVERGTSKSARIDGLSIAAKSGTAEVFVNQKNLALAWMIAFAPVENPKIAIAVIIEGEEPGDSSGGKTAGPVVKAAMKKFFDM